MHATPGRLIRQCSPAVALLCATLTVAASASEELSLDRVGVAVDKATNAVYDNEAMQPNYGTVAESAFLAHMRYNVPQELRNMMGNHALVCWALLAGGESYQNPKLSRRVHWVLSSDQSMTYDRGMRLSMLAELPRRRWRPWVQRDAKWLTKAMTDKGNFTNEWFGIDLTGYGDNANGQYGAWGLWVYQRAGYSLPKKTWKRVDAYWRQAQLKTDGNAAAGWAVISAKAQKEGESSGIAADERASGRSVAAPIPCGRSSQG